MNIAVTARSFGRRLAGAVVAITMCMGPTHAEVASYGSGLILRGTITDHDADVLDARLPQNGTLFLSSPGGSLGAGLRIAQLASMRRASAVVVGNCASACSLPFFAAARRVVKPGTRVGVHSSARADGREDDETLATTARIVRILAEHGVPRTVVAGMMTATPNKMYWLTDRELADLGATQVDTSTAATGPCAGWRIEAPAGFGRIRSAPNLSAPVVERVANGSRIENCNDSRTDERGVVWHNVTAVYHGDAGEQLEAKGWVSRLILAR